MQGPRNWTPRQSPAIRCPQHVAANQETESIFRVARLGSFAEEETPPLPLQHTTSRGIVKRNEKTRVIDTSLALKSSFRSPWKRYRRSHPSLPPRRKYCSTSIVLFSARLDSYLPTLSQTSARSPGNGLRGTPCFNLNRGRAGKQVC